ncbi:MAG: heme NO-binding domain-containing protein [Deltaproteobacteria bacterium]|nr:heme NO-binding domain-containing protein [Deltaproteobacteria bacterium]
MYGLVNKALQDFVISKAGDKTWEEIRRKADVSIHSFVSMESYPDDITYRLAQSTSEIMGIPLERALEGFGEYWILFTAKEGYGEMLDMCGKTIPEFLQNTNDLHQRILLGFPELKPPRLTVTDVRDHSLVLHYHTFRKGLAPFVMGLIKGLGKRLNIPVEVELVKARDLGADHDEFLVKY